MVTMKQFGGRPIECVVDKNLNSEVVNNFCWIHATFSAWKLSENVNESGYQDVGTTFRSSFDEGAIFMLDNEGYKLLRAGQLDMVQKNTVAGSMRYTHGILLNSGAYPGVATTSEDGFIRYHKYVQWVAGILILQVSFVTLYTFLCLSFCFLLILITKVLTAKVCSQFTPLHLPHLLQFCLPT